MGKIVVAFVGLPGSGKSLAADMIKKMGFEVIELGDIWRELLRKNHVSRYDPIGTREFTRKIRNKYGKDVYARYAFRKIQKNRRKVAIMGIRSTYEINYLKGRLRKVYIIALLAPMKMRFGRLKHRGKPEDPKTLESFKWLETREKRGFMKAKSEEKHGVMHIIADADYVIANTSTVKRLGWNVTRVIKEIEAAEAGL
ncbi:MAG: AAA family ATPase [Candidatus Marsarchaeota archaeon]|nr:AAA family ATPase [Candidatus Marsarchaeota archaeon]MCL5413478.1 AAA family ATPase [Candidatus Marsarchaeota archaeon]